MLNNKCFFISAIGDDNSPERLNSNRVLENLIIPAMDSVGFQVVRADQIAGSTEIVKDIFDHLNQDEIVIADITFNNPNVFFEIGYRFNNTKDKDEHKMPILIWNKNLHHDVPFDVRGYRHISYELAAYTIEDERQKLLEFANLIKLPDNLRTVYDKDNNPIKIIILPND